MLVMTGDRPDGEAANWVNVEDIAMKQCQNLPSNDVPQCDQRDQLPVFSMHEHFQEPREDPCS